MMDQINEFQERFDKRIDAIPHPENKVLKGVRDVAVSVLKPQNKVLRWTRNAVLLVVLAPGSFILGPSIVAGISHLADKAGISDSKSWFTDPDSKESLDQEIMGRVNEYLGMAVHKSLQTEIGIIFSYNGVMFNLKIIPLNEKQVKFIVSANEGGKSYSHEGVWPE